MHEDGETTEGLNLLILGPSAHEGALGVCKQSLGSDLIHLSSGTQLPTNGNRKLAQHQGNNGLDVDCG